MPGTQSATIPVWKRSGFLRALAYLVGSGIVAAIVAEASVRDCVADNSGPDEDGSLCGVGYVFGPFVFVGLLGVFVVLELCLRALKANRRVS